LAPHYEMWSPRHPSTHYLTLAEVVAETVGETLQK